MALKGHMKAAFHGMVPEQRCVQPKGHGSDESSNGLIAAGTDELVLRVMYTYIYVESMTIGWMIRTREQHQFEYH